ncbi:MAG: WXG100 family type VII secretion target [Thermoflexales bacterium]|nr:WXG100 family type VII secretion target [Thermoflexales bacterium]
MPSNRVRVDHDQLAQISRGFQTESDSAKGLIQSVRQSMDTLQGGDWVGPGATAFYAEMTGDVLPSLNRLSSALGEASRVTQRISAAFRQAETEAAAVLRGQPGQGGGGPGSPGGGPGAGGDSGSSGGLTGIPFIDGAIDNLAKTFKLKGKFTSGKGFEFGVDLFSGALKSGEFFGGYGKGELGGGLAGIGLKKVDGKWLLGGALEVYAARAKVEGTMVGDKDLGWTGGVDVKVLQGKAFAGYYDGSVGAEAGVNLASIKGETGVNIAGANVGVNAEIGLKLELGLSIGKNTKVKLGPISFGISFGGAKK